MRRGRWISLCGGAALTCQVLMLSCSMSVDTYGFSGENSPIGGDNADIVAVGVGVEDVPIVANSFESKSSLREARCSGTAGVVGASGTVVNSFSEPRDMVVTATWLDGQDGRTLVARTSTVFRGIPSGGSRSFSVDNDVRKESFCTITVMVGDAG